MMMLMVMIICTDDDDDGHDDGGHDNDDNYDDNYGHDDGHDDFQLISIILLYITKYCECSNQPDFWSLCSQTIYAFVCRFVRLSREIHYRRSDLISTLDSTHYLLHYQDGSRAEGGFREASVQLHLGRP